MDFVVRCEQNHLLLDMNKTKQVVVDFSHTTQTRTAVNIQCFNVQIVDSFKDLGVHKNNMVVLQCVTTLCTGEVESWAETGVSWTN